MISPTISSTTSFRVATSAVPYSSATTASSNPSPRNSALVANGDQMGFGKVPTDATKAIIDGIQRVGVRAPFATGWSERAEIDLFDSVLMIENALHDCFSRRCAPLFTTAGLGRPEPALGWLVALASSALPG